MSHYIIISVGGGIMTHRNVSDPSVYNLPDDAEIFEDMEKFENRLAELSGQ